MEQEINISGRLFTDKTITSKSETIEYPFSNFVFYISPITSGKFSITVPGDVPESILAKFCETASKEFEGIVYIWRDCEDYGNTNVFNGGSDYEVVNETCFLSICKNGQSIRQEHTNHWNEKIDSVL